MSKLYVMTTITNRHQKKKFEKFFKKNNLPLLISILAKGTATNQILDDFGLEESEKLLLLTTISDATWIDIKKKLIIDMQIDAPGAGISFIVPISSIGGQRTMQYLLQEQPFDKEEETTLKDTKYELLVAICNQGYTDRVIDASRAAGSGGGTIIHAKGTGMEIAKKMLGVSFTAEKELVLIVTMKEQKNAIMKSIMRKTGLDSKEKAIIFSLPVTSTAGLRTIDNIESIE